MNPAGKLISLVYALLLLACAAAAGFDTFGFAFVIGDGGGQPGVMMSAFLIATLVGLGLAIAALLSWTRSRAISLIALLSSLAVLPASVLFAWASVPAFLHNSQFGFHYSVFNWTSAILPPFLIVAVVVLSWVRMRHFAQPAPNLDHVAP